jgi:hypothetical protein
MLQRLRGDLGLYVSEVAGIAELPAEMQLLPEAQGAANAQCELPDGPVSLIDLELLSRAIDNLVEA